MFMSVIGNTLCTGKCNIVRIKGSIYGIKNNLLSKASFYNLQKIEMGRPGARRNESSPASLILLIFLTLMHDDLLHETYFN